MGRGSARGISRPMGITRRYVRCRCQGVWRIERIRKADGDARSFGPRRRMWESQWLRLGPEPISSSDGTRGRAIIRESALTRGVDVMGVELEASDGNVVMSLGRLHVCRKVFVTQLYLLDLSLRRFRTR